MYGFGVMCLSLGIYQSLWMGTNSCISQCWTVSLGISPEEIKSSKLPIGYMEEHWG